MSKLRKLRKNIGLSQVELADRLGFSQASVSYWERTENVPLEYRDQLAEFFEVDPEELKSPVMELGEELASVEANLRELMSQTKDLTTRLHKARRILGNRKRYSKDAA